MVIDVQGRPLALSLTGSRTTPGTVTGMGLTWRMRQQLCLPPSSGMTMSKSIGQ